MTAGAFLLLATSAHAQVAGLESLIPAGDGAVSGRIIQLVVLLTVLSLAPGLLIMVTSFTRFVVAFSFLRSGLGLQSDARQHFPDQPLPVHDILRHGADLRPGLERRRQAVDENRISEAEAFTKTTEPFREFMLTHVRPKDLQMFSDLAAVNYPKPQRGEEDRPADPRSRPS